MKTIVKIEARIPIYIPDDEDFNKYINEKINNYYMIKDYDIIAINYNPSNFPLVDLEALEMLK